MVLGRAQMGLWFVGFRIVSGGSDRSGNEVTRGVGINHSQENCYLAVIRKAHLSSSRRGRRLFATRQIGRTWNRTKIDWDLCHGQDITLG
jgi:hypothetical protein